MKKTPKRKGRKSGKSAANRRKNGGLNVGNISGACGKSAEVRAKTNNTNVVLPGEITRRPDDKRAKRPPADKTRSVLNSIAMPNTMLASQHTRPSGGKPGVCPDCVPPPGYDADNYLVDEKTGRLNPKKMAAMAPKEKRKIYSDFLLNRLRALHPALGEKVFDMIMARTDEDVVLLCYNCEALRSYVEKCILDLRNRGYFNHVQTCI